jgi:hypothetical protein
MPYRLGDEGKHGLEEEEPMYTSRRLWGRTVSTESVKTMSNLPTYGFCIDHSFIDILKIDIESWEFSHLDNLDQALPRQRHEPLPFGQL